MNVGVVSNNIPPRVQSFRGKNDDETGGGGKAVASFFIPGLGQFLDGRTAAGAGFLGGSIALQLIKFPLLKEYNRAVKEESNAAFPKDVKINSFGDFFKRSKAPLKSPKVLEAMKTSKYKKAKMLGWGALALWVVGIIDAYKGDRSN